MCNYSKGLSEISSQQGTSYIKWPRLPSAEVNVHAELQMLMDAAQIYYG
jgi:hypothetical protein